MPVDILLMGEIGTGKTTFLQGFAEGLGIRTRLTSPTFALEQRYMTSREHSFIHIDLYRLTPAQSEKILFQTNDHRGIRCIEWADRIPNLAEHPRILLRFSEKDDGRLLHVSFEDIPLFTEKTVDEWRTHVHLPANIIKHCEVVADVAQKLAQHLLSQGTIVRMQTLKLAALTHDLFRFIDFGFTTYSPHTAVSETEKQRWEHLRSQYAGLHHEDACAAFLSEQGYPSIASIVQCHGVHLPPKEASTIEQRLLYYSDKRVSHDQVVDVVERFREFAARYNGNIESDASLLWKKSAQLIERDLFPEGPPF